jgi:hypothetical protein
MRLLRIVEIGAVVQLARVGLERRRRLLQSRQRRNRSLGIFALATGMIASWIAVSYLKAEQAPVAEPEEAARAGAPRQGRPPRGGAHDRTAAGRPRRVGRKPVRKVPLKDLSR